MKQKRSKYRIRSKTRFTIFLTMVFLMVTFSANSLFGFNEAESMSIPEYHQIKVEAGDTIWNLALEYGPDEMDIRAFVFQICKINQISADQLQAGQTLLIPKTI